MLQVMAQYIGTPAIQKISDMIAILRDISFGQMPAFRDPWNTNRPYLNDEVVNEFKRLQKYFTPEFLKKVPRTFTYKDAPIPRL